MEKDILKEKADELARGVYRVAKRFPKEEVFGVTSQLRRAALSVVLNYIEGFARSGDRELRNFLQIAYGSLKETKYLIFFCARERYMTKSEYEKLEALADEVGAMLWQKIRRLKEKIR